MHLYDAIVPVYFSVIKLKLTSVTYIPIKLKYKKCIKLSNTKKKEHTYYMIVHYFIEKCGFPPTV